MITQIFDCGLDENDWKYPKELDAEFVITASAKMRGARYIANHLPHKAMHFACIMADKKLADFLTDKVKKFQRDYRYNYVYWAAIGGSVQILEMLIIKYDLKTADMGKKDHCRPICNAISNRNFDFVATLIACNVSLDHWEKSPILSPIHCAVAIGDIRILKYLLEKGAKIHDTSQLEGQLVYLAWKYNHIEILKFLINEQNAEISNNAIAEIIKAYNEDTDSHTEATNILLQKKYRMSCADIKTGRLLYIAVENKDDALVSALLKRKDINTNIIDSQGRTPLHIAVENNRSTTLERLIAHNNTNINAVDSRGRTALNIAVEERSYNVLIELCKNVRIDINAKNIEGKTALHIAAEKDDGGIIATLLDQERTNANEQDFKGRTALHIAVEKFRYSALEELCQHEHVNINAVDSRGRTALHIAVEKGDFFTLDILLKCRDININAVDSQGRTPLHIAVAVYRNEILEKLIAHNGTNINAKDSKGRTAADIAIEISAYSKANLLLEHEDIDVKSLFLKGTKALRIAVTNGVASTVKLLVKHGKIDVNKKYADGKSVLYLAVETGFVSVCEELLANKEKPINEENFIEALGLAFNKKDKEITRALIEKLVGSGYVYYHEKVLKFVLEKHSRYLEKELLLNLANCLGDKGILMSLTSFLRLYYPSGNRESDKKTLELAKDLFGNRKGKEKGKLFSLAFENEDIKAIELLLVCGVDFEEVKAPSGEKFAIWAMKSEIVSEVAEIVINRVDDKNLLNEMLETAVLNGKACEAGLLIKKGADVKHVMQKGVSVLDYAIYHQKNEDVAREVVDSCKNINFADVGKYLGVSTLPYYCMSQFLNFISYNLTERRFSLHKSGAYDPKGFKVDYTTYLNNTGNESFIPAEIQFPLRFAFVICGALKLGQMLFESFGESMKR